MNKTKALRRIFAASVAALALTSNPPHAQPRVASELSGELLLTGSSTMAPLMTDIAKRFGRRHPAVRIDVQGGGSGRGIDDARAGKGIGMVSHALAEREKDLRGYSIGRDGVAVIVHKSNGIADLSPAQLRAIFTGQTTDWKQLGGPHRPIVFIGRTPGRGSTEVMTQYLKVSEKDFKVHRTIGENHDLIVAIAAEPAGIAYVSSGEAQGEALGGVPIRLLRAGGAEASARNILSGDYAVARPLLLVTNHAPAGIERAFIDFALSPAVADLLRKHDFIPYED